MDISQCFAAKSYRCGNIRKFALHKNNIGGINCNVRTRTDSHTYIRSCKRRCVIYSVADHKNLALLFEFGNNFFFTVRHNTCNNFVNTCKLSYSLSCSLIVACEHYNLNAHILQFFNCLRTFVFDNIGNGNYT